MDERTIGAGSISAQGPTVYTGDLIQGIPVISQLNTDDLEPGKQHRFFFQVGPAVLTIAR